MPLLDPARRAARRRTEFLLHELATPRRMVILDVGANPIIPPPYRRLMKQKGCTVVGFEPQADAFARLQASAADNEVYVNAALGRPGPATLHVYPSEGFSSLFALDPGALAFLGKYERQLGREQRIEVTLDSIDALAAVTDIDLLKIDVQGAELDIIAGGRAKLAQAVAVIPEIRFHRLYAGEPLWADLDRELRDQGFVLHKLLSPKAVMLGNSQAGRLDSNRLRSQLVDGDAVYIRSMHDPDAWTDDQLCYLALAADSVFDSGDLCLRCLDLLVARGRLGGHVPEAYARRLDAFSPVPPARKRRGRRAAQQAAVLPAVPPAAALDDGADA